MHSLSHSQFCRILELLLKPLHPLMKTIMRTKDFVVPSGPDIGPLQTCTELIVFDTSHSIHTLENTDQVLHVSAHK